MVGGAGSGLSSMRSSETDFRVVIAVVEMVIKARD